MVIIVLKEFISKCIFSDNEIPLEFRTIFSFRKITEKIFASIEFRTIDSRVSKTAYRTALKFKILEFDFNYSRDFDINSHNVIIGISSSITQKCFKGTSEEDFRQVAHS